MRFDGWISPWLPKKKTAFPSAHFFATLILLLAFPLCCHGQNAASDRRPFVLTLHSYTPSDWDNDLQAGINKELVGPARIDLYIDYMDARKIETTEYLDLLRQLLAVKYRPIKFDLVIVCDDNAYEFAKQYRSQLWPGVPVVFCGVNEFHPQEFASLENFTGISENNDLRAFVTGFPKIVPQLKTLFVVRDDSPYAKDTWPHLDEALRNALPQVQIQFLENTLSAEELANRLAQLPPDSAVFYLSFWRERNGRFINGNEAQRIIGHSGVPVFTSHLSLVGHGALGSCYVDAYDHGLAAGQIARRILEGTPASKIPAAIGPPRRMVFDYASLQRFHISEKSLPAGSAIINEPTSFYRKYKVLVWTTTSIIVLLTALVILLVVFGHQRRRALARLTESEEKFNAFMRALPGFAFIKDTAGQILFMNAAMRKAFGLTPSDHGAQEDPLLLQQRDALAIQADDERLQKTMQPFVSEQTIEIGGARHTFLTSKFPILRHGQPPRFGGLAIDITERKRIEEDLNRTSQWLLATQRISAVGGWTFDLKTKLVWVSPEARRIYGLGEQDLTMPQVQMIPLSEYRSQLDQALKNLVEKGTPYDIEFRIKRSTDGAIIDIHSMAEYDAKEKFVLGVIQDITARKQAEAALRESEEKFAKAFRDSPISMAIRDLDTDFYIEVNNRCLALMGLTREEVIGRTPHEIGWMTAVDMAEVRKHLTEPNSTGLRDHEYNFRRRDGSTAICSYTAHVVRIGGKNCLLSIMVDITEHKRAEDERAKMQSQLNQIQKIESVGRLAGGVAHDFNNMLTAIQINATLAREAIPPDSPLCENLDEILQCTHRSAELTQRLLAFARKQTISPKVLDLNATVEGMLKMLKRLIGEDVDLLWLPANDLHTVKIDPGQIDQILTNLCVNARDAINGVGKITIATQNVAFDQEFCNAHSGFFIGHYVSLNVSDNGCGMDKEVLAHLFEPFFTTKNVGQGTGLGLATVYGIVKQNRGFINVYSEPGHGTTFKVYFPRHAEKAEPAKKEGTAKPFGRGQETILLVEDEPSLLLIAKRTLGNLGYTVLPASTPGDAIQMAEEFSGDIHLLMTDVIMPEMNGRELAQHLLTRYPGMKCLFMSGYTADVIAHQGVLDEGIQFIQKPFSIHDLAGKVRTALNDQANHI